MGTECRSGGGPWATSQDTDGKREGPSGFGRKPAYPSPGASASVKALLKRGLHAEEEEDYLDVQQQELCYYAHAPISAYSASPGAEGAGKASSSFVSGQACECACCMERRSELPAETCGAAASADSGALPAGPACSGCPCCRAGKTASSGVQQQADESSTGRQGETEEPGFAASLPSRRAANSAAVKRERGPQTGPAGERTEDEGREGKDSREDLPAQSRNAENGAPLVGAVVPPYCELAPLVSLSQSCVLERFEALMNKVLSLYGSRTPAKAGKDRNNQSSTTSAGDSSFSPSSSSASSSSSSSSSSSASSSSSSSSCSSSSFSASSSTS
uniref:Histidine acid phosphatase superfamily protein n=2 Tax=Toxoplasma gondii TaxID=5811 RepID=A0A2T6IK74_TOXGO|nr:histidine acid phosphatase superfamily protein [Toxoplasma gondii TgCATBr9]